MRNSGLLGRILIGFGLAGAVFVVVMFAPSWLLAIIVGAWAVLATFEFCRLLRAGDILLNPWLLAVLVAVTVAAGRLGWLPGFIVAPLGVVFIASVLVRAPRPRIPVYGAFAVLYLGFLPAHLVMLKQAAVVNGLSGWVVFFPLLLTWVNDTGGWLFGKLFGRTRLMPQLSPKKTWEGYLAGLAFSGALAALMLSRLAPFAGRPWPYLVVVGLGLGTVSQIGDLFESMFKRAAGIKDSSSVLGEHGGFLDRADSLLFTIPAWYYLLTLYLR